VPNDRIGCGCGEPGRNRLRSYVAEVDDIALEAHSCEVPINGPVGCWRNRKLSQRRARLRIEIVRLETAVAEGEAERHVT
jgi:hypothetical protein